MLTFVTKQIPDVTGAKKHRFVGEYDHDGSKGNSDCLNTLRLRRHRNLFLKQIHENVKYNAGKHTAIVSDIHPRC